MSDSDSTTSSISSFDATELSSTVTEEDADGTTSYIFESTKPIDSRRKQIIDGRKVKVFVRPELGEEDKRIPINRITNFEYTSLIGQRAIQIGEGIPVHPKYRGKSHDLLELARMELDDTSIPFPFKIRRPVGNPTNPVRMEIFDVRELMLPEQLLVNRIDEYMPKTDYKVY